MCQRTYRTIVTAVLLIMVFLGLSSEVRASCAVEQSSKGLTLAMVNQIVHEDGRITYQWRVTNTHEKAVSYVLFQLPPGVVAEEPAHGAIYAGGLTQYRVENPTHQPMYGIRFEVLSDALAGGASDILAFTLPAGTRLTSPLYVKVKRGSTFKKFKFYTDCADVELRKRASRTEISVGDTLTYWLTLRNVGTRYVKNLQVAEAFPAGMVLLDARVGKGTFDADRGDWYVDRLEAGEEVILKLHVRLDVGGVQVNRAEVVAADGKDMDSEPNNKQPEEDDYAEARVTVGGGGSPPVDEEVCYLVADSGGGDGGDDLFVVWDYRTGLETPVGRGTGTYYIEAIAFQPGTRQLFAVDAGQAGLIDRSTGRFIPFDRPVGTGNGFLGMQEFSDIDGLAFVPHDPDKLYATVRKPGNDLLIRIDPATGTFVPGAFNGDDYVVIEAVNGRKDVDDLAISSYDGTVYAIVNDGGYGDHLVRLDLETGEVTDMGPMPVEDVEGLGFDVHGVLYGVQGGDHRSIYRIDPQTVTATKIFALSVGSDYESIDCLTGGLNRISGRVFYDENRNGIPDNGDRGEGNVPVRLYRDVNGNGVVDDGDMLLEERRVPASGVFDYMVASTGYFIVTVSRVDFPAGAQFSTPRSYQVHFTGTGQEDTDNYFGYYLDTAGRIDLALDKSTDVHEVAVGGTVTFTLRAINEGVVDATGVQVQERLPSGMHVVQVTPEQGSYDPSTGIWSVGDLGRGASRSLTLVVQVQEAGTLTNVAEVYAADQEDIDSTPGNQRAEEDDQDDAEVVVLASPPSLTECFATEVVAYSPGTRADGSVLDPRRTNALKALGRPENNEGDVAVSLGFGGHITLRMGGVLYDGDGDDLFAVERSPGISCASHPERARISVSRDGQQFTPVGEVCQDGGVSLEAMPSGVRYVRVEDISDPDQFPGYYDGYDLDGLIGVYCQVVDTQLVDLAISKEADRTHASVGDQVVFELHVHNDGPGVATGVKVYDPLPYGVSLVSYGTGQGTFDPQTGIWHLPDIPVNETMHLKLVTEITSLLDGFQGSVTNEAEIIAADQEDIDSTPNNWVRGEDDNDHVDVAINIPPSAGVADLELKKEVDIPRPEVQATVTYRITLYNRGPDHATGVVVQDVLPQGLALERVEVSQGSFDEDRGYWSLDELWPEASATLTLVARVQVSDTLVNRAQVLLVDQDDPDSTPGNDDPAEDDQDAVTIYPQQPPGGRVFRRPDCSATGTIYDMAYDRSRHILYAVSAAGRVHVSTDGGENWPATYSDSQAALQAVLLTADAVYVGSSGAGVLVSTDQGNQWRSIGPHGATVEALAYDPGSHRLFAGTYGSVQVHDGSGWSDLGTSTSIFAGAQVRALFFDTDRGVLWAAGEQGGVYRYDGHTWQATSEGLPATRINAFLSVDGHFLAATWHDGVYRWSGDRWEPFGSGLERHNVRDLYAGEGQILAGTQREGLFVYDGGTWRQVVNLPAFTVLAAAVDSSGAFFAAVPADGIYRYERKSKASLVGTWYKSSQFLVNAVIQDMALNPRTGEVYAATYGYGVLYSDDGGQCWIRSNRGLTNYWAFAMERASDGTLYIGTWADGLGGVWRSTDNARNWEYLDLGRRQIVALAIDPSNERRIYAGANINGQGALYRSDNGGLTWLTIQSFTRPIWAVRVDPDRSDRLYIGTLGEGVFVSEDGGGSWQALGTGFDGQVYPPHIYDIVVGASGTAYAGRVLAATSKGTYAYEPLANRWVRWGTGLEDEDVRSLLLSGDRLLAGTWAHGVFAFNPTPNTWEDLALGDLPVVAFARHPATDDVLIGTAGQGVYLLSESSITVHSETDALPREIRMEAYPNPMHGQGQVRFALPEATEVSMVLYDVLGRRVQHLGTETMQAGWHTWKLSGESLSSGVYFIRLRAGERIMTRKIIVLH